MAALKYAESTTGYYKVEINRVFEDHGFKYKPGQQITVGEDVLATFLAEEGLLKSVLPES